MANVHRYDNPCKIYQHMPEVEVSNQEYRFYCPHGCQHFSNDQNGLKQLFEHFVKEHSLPPRISPKHSDDLECQSQSLFKIKASYLQKNSMNCK